MKILVLGGAGFVGANLCIHLSKCGHNVTCFDNLVRGGVENNLQELKNNSIEIIRGDIRNPEDFNKITSKPDCVLLCAAQPSATNYSNPVFDVTNNTYGVLNTLAKVREWDASLIFWSTNKCYSGNLCNSISLIEHESKMWVDLTQEPMVGYDPLYGFNEQLSIDGNDRSIYGVSKAMSDILIQEWSNAFKVRSIINRFSCLSGPRQWGLAEQGWVAWFAIANELNLPIEIFGFKGKQVRDNLYVSDLCELIEKQIIALESKEFHGEVFNVGGGVGNTISLLEAMEILETKNKKFWKKSYYDQPRRADQCVYFSDIRKVKNTFDWQPKINPEEGYNLILEWVKENKSKLESMYK